VGSESRASAMAWDRHENIPVHSLPCSDHADPVRIPALRTNGSRTERASGDGRREDMPLFPPRTVRSPSGDGRSGIMRVIGPKLPQDVWRFPWQPPPAKKLGDNIAQFGIAMTEGKAMVGLSSPLGLDPTAPGRPMPIPKAWDVRPFAEGNEYAIVDVLVHFTVPFPTILPHGPRCKSDRKPPTRPSRKVTLSRQPGGAGWHSSVGHSLAGPSAMSRQGRHHTLPMRTAGPGRVGDPSWTKRDGGERLS
jgi:hypothetical protein